MKKTTLIFLLSLICTAITAQQKDFEGTITYNVDTRSKIEGVSDKLWKTMLTLGDSLKVTIKQGNIRRTTAYGDEYDIQQKGKVYLKFNGIDTLFYLDYSSDTSQVVKITKEVEQKKIAGFDCKAITIVTGAASKKYYYSPALYLNPEYNKENRIGRYDVFAKETGSVWLAYFEENKAYTLSHTCTGIRQTAVDDAVFKLPDLPQAKFTYESISTAAKFSGSGGWQKYIQNNLKADLAAKYLKIPRGGNSAMQAVIVDFIVNAQGQVINVQVLNKQEVHPKLAEEAIRVVTESPKWKPATVFNEKVVQRMTQPVVFQLVK